MLHTTWSLALGLINSNGTARHSAAPRQIKINVPKVPKVIVPKGHEKKRQSPESRNGNRNNKSTERSKNNYKS